MNCSINSYKSIVFDCDGVILNSNSIKVQAFYDTQFSEVDVGKSSKLSFS